MKIKTNQEIIDSYIELSYDNAKNPIDEVARLLMNALEAKDEEIKLWKVKFEALKEVSDAIEEDLRREIQFKDKQARQEKIELVEELPIDSVTEIDYSGVSFFEREKVESFDKGRRDKNLEIVKWRNEKLTQLKNEN